MTKIGEIIDDFEAVVPRQMDAHDWRVLDFRGETLTAFTVDTDACTCTCGTLDTGPDTSPEVCDHLAAALFEADRTLSYDDIARHHVAALVDRLQQAVMDVEQAADAVDGPAEESADTAADSDTQPVTNPVGAVEQWLADQGVSLDGVEVYEHDEYGSIQIETNGGLSQDGYDRFRDVVDHDAIGWDGDARVNFIPESKIRAVVE